MLHLTKINFFFLPKRNNKNAFQLVRVSFKSKTSESTDNTTSTSVSSSVSEVTSKSPRRPAVPFSRSRSFPLPSSTPPASTTTEASPEEAATARDISRYRDRETEG